MPYIIRSGGIKKSDMEVFVILQSQIALIVFMPRHKMAGAYSVTPFRHSVILDAVSANYLCHAWRYSNEICHIGLS